MLAWLALPLPALSLRALPFRALLFFVLPFRALLFFALPFRVLPRLALVFIALVFLALPLPRASFAMDAATLVEDAATVANAAPESLAAFPAPRVRAWQVGVIRPDRLEHAGLSFTLGTAFTLAFRDRAAAAATTLALGAGKEYWDSRHNGAEAMDLVADAVGLGFSLLLIRARAP